MSEVQTGGPGPCPVCGGDGEERIGPLTLQCHECGGDGQVGGNPEPEEREDGYRQPYDGEEYDPDAHGPLPPASGYRVWRSPGP